MKYLIFFPIYLIYEYDKNIRNLTCLIYSIIVKKKYLVFYIIILKEISD